MKRIDGMYIIGSIGRFRLPGFGNSAFLRSMSAGELANLWL